MATANRNDPIPAIEQNPPILFDGQRLDQPSFHELYRQTPKHFRAELIEGVVHVMASPVRFRHFHHDASMTGFLYTYSVETQGTVVGNNGTVKLDDENELQPDSALLVGSEFGGQVQIDRDGYMVGCPELVVEISISSLAADLKSKRSTYERAGALEYVVVDIEHRAIFWFTRDGHQFMDLPVGPDSIYKSRAFPGLWLDGRAFMNNDSHAVQEVLQQGLASPEHAAFVARIGLGR